LEGEFHLNWFNILKNAGLVQSQRQGFRLDDKDKDYVLEDDEDCFKKLTTYLSNVFNKFKPEFEVGENTHSGLYTIEAFKPNRKYKSESRRLLSKYYKSFSMLDDKQSNTNVDYCGLLEVLKKINFENLIDSIQDINTIDSLLNENKVVDNFAIEITGKPLNLNDTFPQAIHQIVFYENAGPNQRDIAGYVDKRR
jgi:hypothetical protein